MKLKTVPYFLRQSLVSLRRNGWMSLASTATVAVALFIVGGFSLIILNINYISFYLESNVEAVAFLKVDTPRAAAQTLMGQVRELPGVGSVELVPKEEGLAQLSKQFGKEHDLIAATGGINPLPDYLKVKALNPQAVPQLAEALVKLPQVEKVDYGQGITERLFNILNWLRWMGLVTMLLLSAAAVFLVALTIRLTVYARRKEIGIMKFVGATDWFIRVPFFLEGMLLGLLGALLAVGSLYLAYFSLADKMGYVLAFIPLLKDLHLIGQLFSGLLVAGMVVGAVGSSVSVRHYLRV